MQLEQLDHDHLVLRCRVVQPADALDAWSLAAPVLAVLAYGAAPALVCGSIVLAITSPGGLGTAFAPVGFLAGILLHLLNWARAEPGMPVDPVEPRRWVTLVLHGDRITLDEEEVRDLRIERGALEVDGERLRLHRSLLPEEVAVLRATISQAIALREARAGGSVPEALARLRQAGGE